MCFTDALKENKYSQVSEWKDTREYMSVAGDRKKEKRKMKNEKKEKKKCALTEKQDDLKSLTGVTLKGAGQRHHQ